MPLFCFVFCFARERGSKLPWKGGGGSEPITVVMERDYAVFHKGVVVSALLCSRSVEPWHLPSL